MKTADGRLYVIGGASRSGKTAWTRKQLAKARRAWAWDPEDQWSQLPGWRKVTSRAELMKAAQDPKAQKIAFVTGGKLADGFDFFCQCAYYHGRHVKPEGENLDVVGEELADVTTPSKAPGYWGILLRRGLKRGITLWCISQRWSEADKTAVGNATDFVIFRQSSGDDVIYLARKTGIEADRINGMKPLEFVIKDALTGNIVAGKLRF